MAAMAVEKLSIALEEGVAQAAREAAERHGLSLSAWVNEAAREALAIEDGLAAMGEWEAEEGPISDEAIAWADAALARAGIVPRR